MFQTALYLRAHYLEQVRVTAEFLSFWRINSMIISSGLWQLVTFHEDMMKFLVMPPLTPKDFHFIQVAHGLVVPLFILFAEVKPQTWIAFFSCKVLGK